jgi:hypothetical protein
LARRTAPTDERPTEEQNIEQGTPNSECRRKGCPGRRRKEEADVNRLSWAVLTFLAVTPGVLACSLCNPNLQQTATFRQDVGTSRMILYGAVVKSGLTTAGAGGVSDFQVKAALKDDPWRGDRAVLEVPRYIPVSDPKDPPKYVLFCDVFQGKLDVFRGVPVKSDAAAGYVKGLIALEGKPRADLLRYCFDYLEHPDKEVAQDAFLEFAKASDQEVGEVAAKLAPEKIRRWLKDPQTSEMRLGLYAFLLGACGGAEDADLLRAMVERPTERTQAAYDGLLGGYIHLRPREGWQLALSILKDARQPFAVRFAVVRMLRFYHGWKPKETRDNVLAGMRVVLAQGDLADLAAEDLRRWQEWDLTGEVLPLYGRKGYDAPLMQRALVRYALTCPKPEAARFADELRKKDPELVKDVEESLQFDRPR